MTATITAFLIAWLLFGWIGNILPDYILLVPLVLLLRERRKELVS